MHSECISYFPGKSKRVEIEDDDGKAIKVIFIWKEKLLN